MNKVILMGRLTRDPETGGSGTRTEARRRTSSIAQPSDGQRNLLKSISARACACW